MSGPLYGREAAGIPCDPTAAVRYDTLRFLSTLNDGSHSRRDVRYRVRLPAVLGVGKRSLSTFTEDVSLRGLFVHTDSPPAMRQLVRVEVTLPSGTAVPVNAMVVFVIPPDNPHRRQPGVGLQLYGVGGAQEAAWQAFIRELAERQREAEKHTPPPQLVAQPDPVRRRDPRFVVRLRVLPRNVDALMEMWTRDISRGGMFIETDLDAEPGQLLELAVVHPHTDETFTLGCVVRRVARGSAGRGLGVEMSDLDDERRSAFQEFAMSSIPELDDDVLLIADEDPSLA